MGNGASIAKNGLVITLSVRVCSFPRQSRLLVFARSCVRYNLSVVDSQVVVVIQNGTDERVVQ